MRIKILLLTCFCLLLAFTFQSCDEEIDMTPQVGVCLSTGNDTWNAGLKFFAVKRLNELGLTYSMATPDAAQSQSQQIQAMIDKGSKVLIIVPDGTNHDAIRSAIQQGIPVVLVVNPVVDDYTTIVSYNNITAGENAGNYVKSSDRAVTRVAAFYLEEYEELSEVRLAAFRKGLGTGIPIEVIKLPKYTKDAAKTATLAIFDDLATQDINAIYALDDNLALGVLEAIEQIKSKQIQVIVGCNGNQAMLNAILDYPEIQMATTLQSPSLMATCVDLAAQILRGETPQKDNLQDPVIIDINNAADFLEPNSPF